jgi:hypothetical protein
VLIVWTLIGALEARTSFAVRDYCRSGARAPSVGGLGSEYVLGLKAVNCQSGDALTEEQVTAASKEKVLGADAARLRALAAYKDFSASGETPIPKSPS